MQQIVIFEGNGNNESEVNNFLKSNPNVEVVSVNLIPMHDLYPGTAPTVCSEWVSTVVIYRINDKQV